MSVQQLYLLQKVDISINKLKAEAEQMKKDLLISPALEKATATATAASKVYRELLTNQDRAQVESDTLTSRIIQNEKRLYSGRVTNPKERGGVKNGARVGQLSPVELSSVPDPFTKKTQSKWKELGV